MRICHFVEAFVFRALMIEQSMPLINQTKTKSDFIQGINQNIIININLFS